MRRDVSISPFWREILGVGPREPPYAWGAPLCSHLLLGVVDAPGGTLPLPLVEDPRIDYVRLNSPARARFDLVPGSRSGSAAHPGPDLEAVLLADPVRANDLDGDQRAN